MDDLISRKHAIDEAEKWFFNLNDKRNVGEVLKGLPSIDAINRQEAIDKIKERLYETAFNSVGFEQDVDVTLEDVAKNRLEIWFDDVPSVQPNHNADPGKKVDAIPVEWIEAKMRNSVGPAGKYVIDWLLTAWREEQKNENWSGI